MVIGLYAFTVTHKNNKPNDSDHTENIEWQLPTEVVDYQTGQI